MILPVHLRISVRLFFVTDNWLDGPKIFFNESVIAISACSDLLSTEQIASYEPLINDLTHLIHLMFRQQQPISNFVYHFCLR